MLLDIIMCYYVLLGVLGVIRCYYVLLSVIRCY